MSELSLSTWQLALAGILYAAYLAWVMFGGMKRKRVKLRVYVIMTALMIYGTVKEFTGIGSRVEVYNIILILLIGLIKGVILGRKKIAEKIDHVWYIHHDWKYIVIWICFYALKSILSYVLKTAYDTSFPTWHMILYFAFYYPWRTFNIFWNNPEMRKDILQREGKSTV